MWFDAQMSGIIGGILGSSIGICCGVWGAMAGIFARKGRYKKFILSFAGVLAILGAVSLCTGIFALVIRQPYHVWFLFCVIGFVLTVCLLPNIFNVKRVYISAELNKMSADDL